MHATVLHGAGDVRIENVRDATLVASTDALLRITGACICGSDLWPYRGLGRSADGGIAMGHEAIGVVEEVGRDVSRIKKGDFVVMPFAYSDGSCAFCHEGLQTSCVHGGFFGIGGEAGGAQAEAVRVPLADGTLFPLPSREESAVASLLTLSDVMGTGHHAAVVARVGHGKKASVVGDGAVGTALLPRSVWAPSRSSFLAGIRTVLRSPGSLVPPISLASGVRKQSSAYAPSPGALASTRC